MNDMAHRLDDVSQSEHLGSRVNNLSILDALGIVRCFVAFLLSVTKGAQDVPVRGGWNANTIRATSYRSVVMKPGERVIEGVSVRALAALFKLVKSFHDRIERLLDRVQLRQDQLADRSAHVNSVCKSHRNIAAFRVFEVVPICRRVMVLFRYSIWANKNPFLFDFSFRRFCVRSA